MFKAIVSIAKARNDSDEYKDAQKVYGKIATIAQVKVTDLLDKVEETKRSFEKEEKKLNKNVDDVKSEITEIENNIESAVEAVTRLSLQIKRDIEKLNTGVKAEWVGHLESEIKEATLKVEGFKKEIQEIEEGKLRMEKDQERIERSMNERIEAIGKLLETCKAKAQHEMERLKSKYEKKVEETEKVARELGSKVERLIGEEGELTGQMKELANTTESLVKELGTLGDN